MDARLVTDLEGLQDHLPAWDRLAELHGLPYCSPHWMLPWWRERAPAGSELRVLLALDGERLAGVFPWYRESSEGRLRAWRQLCAGFCTRLAPLAEPGEEEAVAAAVVPHLAGERGPDILALEGLPEQSPWPMLLRAAWPRRLPPLVHRDLSMQAPIALLDGGFDDWLARRGDTVRRTIPRRRRRLEEQGVSVRLARRDELEWAVAGLCELYRERWEWRGGSERLAHGLEEMLVAAGRELGDRMQLWLLDHADGPVGAYLFVRAGDLLSDWGGGFREEWSRYSPTYVLRLAAAEHAAEQGVKVIEFAEGTQRDKLHFADGQTVIDWFTVLPRGGRYPLARAKLFPAHARQRARSLARRLPDPLQALLRRVAAALRRS